MRNEQFLDKVENEIVKEDELNDIEDIEEGVEQFTGIEYGQYGWNFKAINKGTVYYNDGSEKNVVITYSVREVKAPRNADYETLWEAYCKDTTGAYQDRTFYFLNNEDIDLYMELKGAKNLETLLKNYLDEIDN